MVMRGVGFDAKAVDLGEADLSHLHRYLGIKSTMNVTGNDIRA